MPSLSPETTDPEIMLQDDMASFYADPMGFVMYAYPWDTDKTIQIVELVEPWASRYNSKYGPDKWACEYLDVLAKEVAKRGFNGKDAVDPIRMAVASGHGVGKSAMTGWLVNWIMSTRPLSQGTVTANTFTQLETKTWAQIIKWANKCVTAHWFSISASKIYHRASKRMVLLCPDLPRRKLGSICWSACRQQHIVLH